MAVEVSPKVIAPISDAAAYALDRLFYCQRLGHRSVWHLKNCPGWCIEDYPERGTDLQVLRTRFVGFTPDGIAVVDASGDAFDNLAAAQASLLRLELHARRRTQEEIE